MRHACPAPHTCSCLDCCSTCCCAASIAASRADSSASRALWERAAACTTPQTPPSASAHCSCEHGCMSNLVLGNHTDLVCSALHLLTDSCTPLLFHLSSVILLLTAASNYATIVPSMAAVATTATSCPCCHHNASPAGRPRLPPAPAQMPLPALHASGTPASAASAPPAGAGAAQPRCPPAAAGAEWKP